MIDLPENEPLIVEKMVHFLYHGTYVGIPEEEEEEDDDEDTSKVTDDLHSTRDNDKDVNLAAESVSTSLLLTSPLVVHAHVYAIAEQYDIPVLKKYAMEEYEEEVSDHWNTVGFSDSIRILYELTPENDREMKKIAMKVVGDRIKQLLDRGEFVSLCRDNGEIAFDALAASQLAKSSAVRRCSGCTRTANVLVGDARGKFYCPTRGCNYSYFN